MNTRFHLSGVLIAALGFALESSLVWANVPALPAKNDSVLVLINSKGNAKNVKDATKPVRDPGLCQASDPQVHANQNVDPLPATPQEAEILPHRATYAIRLAKAHDEEISDVTGTMTLETLDTENGWTYEHRATLMIYDQQGNADQVVIKVASWEAKDGKSYRFNSYVTRNDEPEQDLRGHVAETENGELAVTYESPEQATVILPTGTKFPIRHLVQMMQDAVAGKRVSSSGVYDGTSETRDSVAVNTVITPMPKPNVAYSDKVPFPTDHVWLMHMAVYGQEATEDAEPDYEISQKVLPHGIIAAMTLNFGEFDAELTLTELDFFPN